MWKLIKAELQYSIVSILAVYICSFIFLSLIVGIVILKPEVSISDADDLSKFMLFLAMMLPQFAVLSGISKDFEREKRSRLIFTLPLKSLDYISGAWSIIVILQMVTVTMGITYALTMYFIKSCTLFNTVLGLNGAILTLSGLKLLTHIIEGKTGLFKPFRGIRIIVFIIILFGGMFIFIYSQGTIAPPFEAIYKVNGIVFLHLLGIFLLLLSYLGMKRISPVK